MGVTAFVVVKAGLALSRREPYRLGWLDGGLAFHGRELHPGWMLLAAGLYLFFISALLAWPLGLYGWLEDLLRPLVPPHQWGRYRRWFRVSAAGCVLVVPVVAALVAWIVTAVRRRRAVRRAIDGD